MYCALSIREERICSFVVRVSASERTNASVYLRVVVECFDDSPSCFRSADVLE